MNGSSQVRRALRTIFRLLTRSAKRIRRRTMGSSGEAVLLKPDSRTSSLRPSVSGLFHLARGNRCFADSL